MVLGSTESSTQHSWHKKTKVTLNVNECLVVICEAVGAFITTSM